MTTESPNRSYSVISSKTQSSEINVTAGQRKEEAASGNNNDLQTST